MRTSFPFAFPCPPNVFRHDERLAVTGGVRGFCGSDTERVIRTRPPGRSFASDNLAGAHPAILAALSAANEGHALPYGADDHTRRLEDEMCRLFDHDVIIRPVFGGTGANVVALGCALAPGEAVACSAVAHIAVDEAGAPERLLGAKLIGLPHVSGKISVDAVSALSGLRGSQHHAPAGALSLTQATEMGTLYTIPEIQTLAEAAHALDMRVHMDGARIANAVAALGGDRRTLRDMTVGAGVDLLSFGGTKNGIFFGELVVFFDRKLAEHSLNLRKQMTQLPSKMRFVSAQYLALIEDDLFIKLAHQSNLRAADLYHAVSDISELNMHAAPQVNSLFPTLAPGVKKALQDWSFFWDWDPSSGLCRWMTAWDTTADDVETFVAGVRECLVAQP